MDKTDKPNSVREILEKYTASLQANWGDGDGMLTEDDVIRSIYSLLAEGVEDKECSCGETTRNTWGCECGAEAFNQANALWRKHLQTNLGLMPREDINGQRKGLRGKEDCIKD